MAPVLAEPGIYECLALRPDVEAHSKLAWVGPLGRSLFAAHIYPYIACLLELPALPLHEIPFFPRPLMPIYVMLAET